MPFFHCHRNYFKDKLSQYLHKLVREDGLEDIPSNVESTELYQPNSNVHKSWISDFIDGKFNEVAKPYLRAKDKNSFCDDLAKKEPLHLLCIGWSLADKDLRDVQRCFARVGYAAEEANKNHPLWEIIRLGYRALAVVEEPNVHQRVTNLMTDFPNYVPGIILNAAATKKAENINLEKIETTDNSMYVPAAMTLAQIYFENGEYQDAIKLLNELKDVDEAPPQAFSLLCDCYAKTGDWDEAAGEAYSALERHKEVSSKPQKTAADLDYSLTKQDIQQLQARISFFKAKKALDEYIARLQSKLESPKVSNEEKAKIQPKVTALVSMNEEFNKNLIEFFKGEINQHTLTNILKKDMDKLKVQRGYGRIIKNIILAIGLLGVGYIIAGAIHYAVTKKQHFVFFNDTTSTKKVKEVAKQIKKLEPRRP